MNSSHTTSYMSWTLQSHYSVGIVGKTCTVADRVIGGVALRWENATIATPDAEAQR
jgi:hypothetical protein